MQIVCGEGKSIGGWGRGVRTFCVSECVSECVARGKGADSQWVGKEWVEEGRQRFEGRGQGAGGGGGSHKCRHADNKVAGLEEQTIGA